SSYIVVKINNGVVYNSYRTVVQSQREVPKWLLLQNQDAYLKVAGGVKLDEPAIDLAIAISIASSFRDT
ncbi:hypothetical protein MOC13_19930, partial [Bacillus inaquosorum]|nr:hypothetical protein [Bacillus inaquosorum]